MNNLSPFILSNKRPVYSIIHDVMYAPSSGDVSYNGGNNLFFTIRTLPGEWFDCKNSFIEADVDFTLGRIGPSIYAGDIMAGFDITSFAIFKKLKVYLNKTLCEETDNFNVLFPTLLSFNNFNLSSSSLFSTGIASEQTDLNFTTVPDLAGDNYVQDIGANVDRAINIYTQLYFGNYFMNIPGLIEPDLSTGQVETSTTLTGSYIHLSFFIPSSLVGIFSKHILPSGYMNNIQIEIQLEDANIAIGAKLSKIKLTRSDTTTYPSYIKSLGSNSYTLKNIKFHQRFIELKGEILESISSQYLNNYGINFSLECEMYANRFQYFLMNSSSIVLNYKFNVTSAQSIIMILRPHYITQPNTFLSTSVPSNTLYPSSFLSLSTRYSNINGYRLTINGNEYPETGDYIDISSLENDIGTTLNNYNGQFIVNSNYLNKLLGTFQKSLNDNNTFSSINRNTYLIYLNQDSTGIAANGDDPFCLAYPFEPSSVLDSKTSSTQSLNSLNDLSVYLKVDNVNNLNVRMDVFVKHIVHIIFNNGNIIVEGGR